ncbi:MAG: phosphatase PAP2 family protein [Gemmatimonadetes bacterium]|nr:phosphatase PAP2 family protein [Gemmatimonadota bacterium]
MLGAERLGGVFRVAHPVIAHLDARDRAMFVRMASRARRGASSQWCWTGLTHLGGATVTIALSLGCLLSGKGSWAIGGRAALIILVTSHLLVQLIKRSVGRPRPSEGLEAAALIAAPDRFSFPSGHAAAVASVALGLGQAFPDWSPLLGTVAVLVGFSRVALGVHYPGDVLAGQVLAVLSAWLLRGM